MVETGIIGIGQATLSRRERAAPVEPRGAGMLLIALRAADEMRPADFAAAEAEIDDERVAGAVQPSGVDLVDTGTAAEQIEAPMRTLLLLLRDENGVAAVEYGLIAALVSVASISAFRLVGSHLRDVFNTVASNL